MCDSGDHLADGGQAFRLDQAVPRFPQLANADQARAQGVRIDRFEDVIVDSMPKGRDRPAEVGVPGDDQGPGARCGFRISGRRSSAVPSGRR